MVFFCGSDENRVDIDSDNHMPDVVQITAESARPAPCIENPATASEHRVDQTCFPPDNVLAVRSHGTETLDISCGMRRVAAVISSHWLGMRSFGACAVIFRGYRQLTGCRRPSRLRHIRRGLDEGT